MLHMRIFMLDKCYFVYLLDVNFTDKVVSRPVRFVVEINEKVKLRLLLWWYSYLVSEQ